MEVHIFVKPGKKKNEILGQDENGRLCISLTARAQDGGANEALIEFLARTWQVPKSKVKLIKGHQARYKTVQLTE
ncbi:MAG: hypothetical protein K0S08_1628 [Gammaproteobacteria bacterium]|jgi:uncharacterized protein (TIGR00251 family)|nr:hypothetical protein [Gammaproteobacteria bacterium]